MFSSLCQLGDLQPVKPVLLKLLANDLLLKQNILDIVDYSLLLYIKESSFTGPLRLQGFGFYNLKKSCTSFTHIWTSWRTSGKFLKPHSFLQQTMFITTCAALSVCSTLHSMKFLQQAVRGALLWCYGNIVC